MRSRGAFYSTNPPPKRRKLRSEFLPEQLQELPDPFVIAGRADHFLVNRVEATTRTNSDVRAPPTAQKCDIFPFDTFFFGPHPKIIVRFDTRPSPLQTPFFWMAGSPLFPLFSNAFDSKTRPIKRPICLARTSRNFPPSDHHPAPRRRLRYSEVDTLTRRKRRHSATLPRGADGGKEGGGEGFTDLESYMIASM